MKDSIVKTKIDVRINQQDVMDIADAAYDGAIDYWCEAILYDDEEKYGHGFDEQLLNGGILILDTDDGKFTLTYERIVRGIEMYLEDPERPYEILEYDPCRREWKIDQCNVDDIVVDMIMQYAVFHDLVFS